MKPIHILLAEDDPISAYITEEAFQKAPFAYTLGKVSDGGQALLYLCKEGVYSRVPSVDLLMLDLNMPVKDGIEVLEEMRLQPGLRNTPVIILTTSSAQRDIEATFKAHACCYITKPFDEEQLIKAIDIIKQTWLPSSNTV